MSYAKTISTLRLALGFLWLGGQFYIVQYPLVPMIQRPVHLMFALGLVILWMPLNGARIDRALARTIDLLLLAVVVAATVYYLAMAERFTSRMEGIDPVLAVDVVFGVLIVLVMLECVRRTVGWSLLGVILAFVAYGFLGKLFPGWMRFRGFDLLETVENFTMTANGVLGLTTETSVQIVFYFVAFGAFYAAIGGSQLFIDLSLTAVGRHKGGAAKAAVVSSSMMGSISGSAVANVATTGVFTIPLMKRSGLTAERAAATEAIASTGGQLMPPIMGIAAFVMAELLQTDYGRIALAGIIPAVGFYVAIFLAVDLHARKSGTGTVGKAEIGEFPPLVPRLYLLIPPIVLIGALVMGYSATRCAVYAILACVITAYLRRESWLDLRGWIATVGDATKQAAQVAVPIAAIGMIIAVAIQSNLALKFSTRLIDISGGNLYLAMGLIIIGCLIMGMGLPTVAAYIIGAILFAPTLVQLGIPLLAAHFFVMYYCVLSMITPPVALASYTAAGMSSANVMKASLLAFQISLVSFFIPFGFAFDEALLGNGAIHWIVFAFASLMAGTASWAIALTGYLKGDLALVERLFFGAASVAVIFSPTGTMEWAVGMVTVIVLAAWRLILRPRFGLPVKAGGD